MHTIFRLGLAAATFAALALGWRLVDGLSKPAAAQAAPTVQRDPYVASSTRLSPNELFRVVIVPHPLGRHFDMRCLLYTGDSGAQLVCPNATQEQLEDREAPR